MMQVLLPDNNHAERRYAVEVLLKAFLGLTFELYFSDTSHTSLLLENGNRLVIEDHFFHYHPAEKSYLSPENLPRQVFFTKKTDHPFLPEEDMPVIFGDGKLEVSDNQIVCGVDVFAAAFFMLSRWEEIVNPAKDQHERFPANASLAGQFNFLHRPVVNEYAEMLWNMLARLGIRQKRKHRSFELLLTHDVDFPRLWRSGGAFLKKLGGDLIKRRSIREAAFSISSYARTRLGQPDPYDTFDYLMQVAERAGAPAHFFFMSGGNARLDPRGYPPEQPLIQTLLQNIHERGHRIGIHPSYDSYLDENRWALEKQRLERLSPQPLTCGRQHFLRFAAPATWQIWENQKMEWDSTLGYAEKEGFRCGTCDAFPVFNVLDRKQLSLLERPLLVMDGTLRVYQNLPPEAMLARIQPLLQTVKKYNGTFSILWHNSAFLTPQYLPCRHVYEQVVREAAAN